MGVQVSNGIRAIGARGQVALALVLIVHGKTRRFARGAVVEACSTLSTLQAVTQLVVLQLPLLMRVVQPNMGLDLRVPFHAFPSLALVCDLDGAGRWGTTASQ
ncbi:hypothetical protein B0T24DRAFT_677331 [Lasiosphaeria ovina]|uniref:Uncharacterized protein n=1 Tax=Lasiosphaeria ovina TaxID=92902 RepID=A0AAE0NBD9_9PEZI|nr:hypothetical protein B0T24DRAFT_677331 [Lasiosphaeria ovina]